MTPTPHDALFKATFSTPEHAAEILRALVDPELAAQIDWTSLVLQPGSFIDEALRARHADLLFTARLGPRNIRLYLLLEHKSAADDLVALWLLKYMLRIWEAGLAADRDAAKLAPILPVVLYHGARGWTSPTEFSELVDIPAGAEALRAFTPKFRYALADLSTADSAALRARAGSAAVRLALLALKETRSAGDLTALLAGWAAVLRELLRQPRGADAFQHVLSYLFAVRGPAEFHGLDLRAIDIGEQGEAIMETMAGALIEKGIQKGLLRGRQEGIQEGRQEFFLRLLRRKFPQTPAALIARAEAADAATLELWGEQLLTATTVDEVFADPAP